MATKDTTLLERWAAGRDPEAFDEIVSRYGGLVYSTCRRILSSDADAEDVTQECFFSLACGGTRRIVSLGAWLHTVATRRSLNLLKKDARRRRHEQTQVDRARSDRMADLDELRLHVDRAIESLPPKLRRVVISHFLERRSHETIARDLGLTRQAVGYRARKGVEMIRRKLRKSGLIAGSTTLSVLFDSEATRAAPASLGATLGRIAISGAPATPIGAPATPIGAAGRTIQLSLRLVPFAAAVPLITGGALYMAIDGQSKEVLEPAERLPVVTSRGTPERTRHIEEPTEKETRRDTENAPPWRLRKSRASWGAL